MKGITAKYLWANIGVMIISLSLLGPAGYGVITNHYRSYPEKSLLKRAHSYAEILTRHQDIKTLDLLTRMEEYPAARFLYYLEEVERTRCFPRCSCGYIIKADWHCCPQCGGVVKPSSGQVEEVKGE
ncbi:hypothetical protein GXN76_10135 [Kroppenstedtia pulmonis]|uniref:Uncharacterized protein n=1 Tax=Kroppenstedtia pulmonis TaxID=1380685 RepID=A0A7D4CNG1_9BACL|nr:hypothetical protein [Kroppenstedtia pulmonis]QKG84798.1 hypothetical protein GXN76_10135 [Kroppenstedtia pulmonis]